MRWAESFIAVDWGTTNRRAYLIDSTGACIAEMEDDRGAFAIPRGEFPSAVRQIRDSLGDLPLLLGGMAGSNRGWVDAPYLSCPAGLEDLAGALVHIPGERAVIVPGLAVRAPDRCDVMRGEEIQVLGAGAVGTIPDHCLVCHPGTHNKWALFAGGRIESFRTVMTGELFGLLKKSGVIADVLQNEARADAIFDRGVSRGLEETVLSAELFSIRAGVLLGRLDPDDAASYASGLLIGADLRVGLADAGDEELIVMGRPELTGLYARALQLAGRPAREIDGEGAFIAGAVRIARMIE